MKIVVLTTPRTGSTAFCDIQNVEKNLNECMNIEDMILPRNENNEIIEDSMSGEFNEVLHKRHPLSTLYLKSPNLPNVKYIDLDENLNQVYTSRKASLNEFLSAHRRRWEIINKNWSSWVLKIMHFHLIDDKLMDEILMTADKIIVLSRRNKIDQVASMIHTMITSEFHTTDENYTVYNDIDFPYNTGVSMLKSVIESENDYIEKAKKYPEKFEHLYYEDLDLSNSRYKKLKVKSNYNKKKFINTLEMNECYSIYQDTEYSEFIQEAMEKFNELDFNLKIEYNSSMIENFKRQTKNLNHLMGPLLMIDKFMSSRNKDIEILDIGTHFGILEYLLINLNYKNIDSTNLTTSEELTKIRNCLNLPHPFDLEITPFQKLNLNKKYDLITIFHSEAFWKINSNKNNEIVLLNYNTGELSDFENMKRINGELYRAFIPWKSPEWEFFIKDIKNYLKPEGIAVIQPAGHGDFKNVDSMKNTINILNEYNLQSNYYTEITSLGKNDFYVIIENIK